MLERSKCGGRAAAIAVALSVSLLGSVSTVRCEGWCDLVFKDIVGRASNVIIARYQQAGKSEPSVSVVEVLKG